MRADSITVGDTLKLKSDNAYGKTDLLVTVTAITHKDGYKTPWIWSGADAYRPSDFTAKVGSSEAHYGDWRDDWPGSTATFG